MDPKSSPCRVLLVEDHAAARGALAELLRDAGFAVAEACDGARALAMLEAAAPDVIVSDIDMPRLDGLELRRRLLAGSVAARLVLMSGDDPPALAAQEFVAKPIRFDELLRAIERVRAAA